MNAKKLFKIVSLLAIVSLLLVGCNNKMAKNPATVWPWTWGDRTAEATWKLASDDCKSRGQTLLGLNKKGTDWTCGIASAQPNPPAAPLPPSDGGNTQTSFTRADVDAQFGAGNWSCFYDRLDGVAVHNLPLNYTVGGVVSAVDKGQKYTTGMVVPGTGGATAWLGGQLASREECPSIGQQSIVLAVDCQISKYGEIYFRPPAGDQNVGKMAKIHALNPFTVPAGWTVDNPTGKFVGGQQVSAGDWSVWAPIECYGQIR